MGQDSDKVAFLELDVIIVRYHYILILISLHDQNMLLSLAFKA